MLRFLFIVLCMFLLGQDDCTPLPDPGYCAGAPKAPIVPDTIVGGVIAKERNSTVLLSGCSGTIIGPHTVLTAAHCGSKWDGRVVRLNRDDPGTPIVGRLEHPGYREWKSNGDLEARKSDLQLLYTGKVLPKPYIEVYYDYRKFARQCDELLMQGWGRDDDWNPATELLEAPMYILKYDDPKQLQADVIKEPGGFCYGDSGGPLYANVDGYMMLAAVNVTLNQTDCKGQSNHVLLTYFEEWIRANTR